MTVFRNSRYRNSDVLVIRDDRNGKTRKWVSPSPTVVDPDKTRGFRDYVSRTGDELDGVSKIFGGEEHQWWLIAEANRILFAFDLDTGDELLIPSSVDFQKFK